MDVRGTVIGEVRRRLKQANIQRNAEFAVIFTLSAVALQANVIPVAFCVDVHRKVGSKCCCSTLPQIPFD